MAARSASTTASSASTRSDDAPRARRRVATVVAGAASGVTAAVLLQPLEVAKTRQQAHAAEGLKASRNLAGVLRAVARREGVRGLWAGVGASCWRLAGGVGLYFVVLDEAERAARRAFGEATGAAKALQTVAVGAASRSLAAAALCPLTVAKTRLEYAAASGRAYTGTLHALGSIARHEGARGLWSGLGATLLRDAPFSGIHLLMYRSLSAYATGTLGLEASTPLTAACGATAGSLATMITHPPDVVRTRLQLRAAATGTNARRLAAVAARHPRGAAPTTLAGIVAVEGVWALWTGATPRVLRRALQQAITWSLFEKVASLYEAGAAKD